LPRPMCLDLKAARMVIEFCDYDDGKGNVCNRDVEFAIKKENYNLYVCKRCLYMVDIDPDIDEVAYITRHGRIDNA